MGTARAIGGFFFALAGLLSIAIFKEIASPEFKQGVGYIAFAIPAALFALGCILQLDWPEVRYQKQREREEQAARERREEEMSRPLPTGFSLPPGQKVRKRSQPWRASQPSFVVSRPPSQAVKEHREGSLDE